MLSEEQLIRAALTGAGFGDMTEAAVIDALELIESGDEEVIAEVAGLRAVAEAAVKDAVGEDKPFGWYFMDDPKVFTLPGVGFRVGAEPPTDSIDRIPLYTRPQASAAVPDEWREVLQDLVTRFDERLPLREAGVIWKQAKALLAASQPEVKS